MRRSVLSVLVILAGSMTPTAQAPAPGPSPTFDVVSVKPNRSNQGLAIVVFQPGGRVVGANVSVRQVILVAYGLEDVQLVNAPDWTRTERFAIEARTRDDTATSSIRLMLRAMLAERFGLTVHEERRESAMYALVTARADSRLGPRMRLSGPECASIQPPPGVPMPPPPPPTPAGASGEVRLILPTDEPLRRRCGAMIFPGWISARAITMKQFAAPLTQLLRRPVVDETGLTGDYDLDLTYAPDQSAPTGPPGAPGPPPPAADAPSIFTALQEDLGLKLDSRRGPIEVLVVDRIERPSEN
jgi:uncharacterized protein (TIGR03435 family)